MLSCLGGVILNTHIKNVLKILVYFIIPIISILFCRGLKIAQGEQNEEIVFGIMLGVFFDFVYCIVLTLLDKQKKYLLVLWGVLQNDYF